MILATNNKGKIEEIKKILNKDDIYSLKEKNIFIDVEEGETNSLENARKKAHDIYNISKEETIADDTGLYINCLDGFPGVLTHRFLGEDATDKMRNEYLINEVNKYNDRSAKVICYLVYYDGKNEIIGEGVLDGFISNKCRGKNGFGFDEIFELANGKTLAELSLEEKNKISARAKAIKNLKEKMYKILK